MAGSVNGSGNGSTNDAATTPPTLLDRIVRGQWVGRTRELAEADALWRRAAAGEGHALLVGGEAGVGKTRFIRELASRAQAAGGLILTGECYAEGDAPYAPIAQAVRESYETGAATELSLPGTVLSDLLALAPTLRAHYPGVAPNPTLDPLSQQQRLFESVAAWCAALSARAPLLLFVDDVHWADSGTLLLLRHLARRARRLPVLIVMTFRAAELESDPGGALAGVVLDLNRERLALQLTLGRLSRDETRDLLGALFAEEITPDFLNGIYGQTEGNPFFIEEVCKALIDAGDLSYRDGRWRRPDMQAIKIPQTVRAVIQSRVAKLPPPAQDALRVAAVLGREFDYETLRRTGDLDEEALLAALESASRAQLIAEVQGKRADVTSFAFAHVLIPTTLRESILGVRRQRLHLRAAQALEAVRPDDLEALAYHYAAAGDAERARRYYLQAGDRAQKAAPEDAARLFHAALGHTPEADRAGRADTLARLGYCQWVATDVQCALQSLEAACALYDALGNRTQGGEMHRMIGRIYWEQADRATALQHYHRAFEILEQGPVTVELARAISSISQMHMLGGEDDQAIAWGERALAIAGQLGAEDVIVHALNNIGSSQLNAGAFEEGLAMLRESLRRALAAGLAHDACRAYFNIADSLHRISRYAEAYAVGQELHAYASRMYVKMFVHTSARHLAWESWYLGRWREALSHRSQMPATSTLLNVTLTKRVFGMMDLDLGRVEEAHQELEEALPSALLADEYQTTGVHLGQMVRLYATLGQGPKADRAAQMILDVTERLPHPYADAAMPLLYACWWLASKGTPADLEKARACLTLLESLDHQAHTGETGACLSESCGYAALAQGHLREAEDHFRQASAHWESIQRPYDRARTLSQLGRVLTTMGNAPASRHALEQAGDILDSLAAQLDGDLKTTFEHSPSSLVRQTRDQLRQLPTHTPTPRQTAKEKFDGLTEREREIAALIAQGKTNRAIAEQLVIGERTVEKHVENIMGKLGFSSRARVAAWATEKGLTHAQP
jgi:DNA-binding CsgD family transcriptional regulator